VPIAPCPAAGHHGDDPGSSLQMFMHTGKIPLSHLFSQLPQPLPLHQMLQSLHHLHGSLPGSRQQVHVWLVRCHPEPDRSLWTCLTHAERRGRIPSSTLVHLKMCGWPALPQRHIAGSWSTCCPPAPLLESCFSARWPPACTGAWDCFSSAAGLHVPLLNFMRFVSGPFSSLSLWMAEDPLVYQPLCPGPPLTPQREQGTAWPSQHPAPSALRVQPSKFWGLVRVPFLAERCGISMAGQLTNCQEKPASREEVSPTAEQIMGQQKQQLIPNRSIFLSYVFSMTG